MLSVHTMPDPNMDDMWSHATATEMTLADSPSASDILQLARELMQNNSGEVEDAIGTSISEQEKDEVMAALMNAKADEDIAQILASLEDDPLSDMGMPPSQWNMTEAAVGPAPVFGQSLLDGFMSSPMLTVGDHMTSLPDYQSPMLGCNSLPNLTAFEVPTPLLQTSAYPSFTARTPIAPRYPIQAAAHDEQISSPIENAQDQQQHFPTVISQTNENTMTQVHVTIKNEKLWSHFYAETNEMITSSKGRHLFPTIQLSVTGLEPEENYMVWVHFQSTDDEASYWRWTDSAGWTSHRKRPNKKSGTVTSGSDSQSSPNPAGKPKQMYTLPSSPCSGKALMSEDGLNFSKIRISNSPGSTDAVFLESFKMYIPVLYIVPAQGDPNSAIFSQPRDVMRFPLQVCSFITATSYHNKKITHLKVLANPMARASELYHDRDKNQIEALEQTYAAPPARPPSGDGSMSDSEAYPSTHKSKLVRSNSSLLPQLSPSPATSIMHSPNMGPGPLMRSVSTSALSFDLDSMDWSSTVTSPPGFGTPSPDSLPSTPTLTAHSAIPMAMRHGHQILQRSMSLDNAQMLRGTVRARPTTFPGMFRPSGMPSPHRATPYVNVHSPIAMSFDPISPNMVMGMPNMGMVQGPFHSLSPAALHGTTGITTGISPPRIQMGNLRITTLKRRAPAPTEYVKMVFPGENMEGNKAGSTGSA